MPTLIRNVGVLDARQASVEQVSAIGRIMNVGCLVVSPANRAEFMKVGLHNVGKTHELDEDYKIHTGPLQLTREMLESAANPLKICVLGSLEVETGIPAELLLAKLEGIYLIGPASVPEELYGAFMSRAKDITGHVSVEPAGSVRAKGKVLINNEYLNQLEDGTDLSVSGNASLDEALDLDLFKRKIKTLRVAGVIHFGQAQEETLRKLLVQNEKTRLKMYRLDFHYVPGGTVIDSFTLLTVDKRVFSCHGILILHEEVTPEEIREKNLRFEAGTLYFPKSVTREMATRLAPKTRGLPYDPDKFAVVGCEQLITQARLAEMPDKGTLVVTGSLEIDPQVPPADISAKVAILDNYGEIIATRDVSSVLQAKLRVNEGVMHGPEGDEEEDDPCQGQYDNVIENLASYTL